MKILVVCRSNPYNPSTGGQNRTYNLISRLSKVAQIATLEPHTNRDTTPTFSVSERYFYNDYEILSKRVGLFFASINPDYYQSLNESIKDFSPEIIHKIGPNGYVPLSVLGRHSNVVYSAHNFEYQHAEEIDANLIERKLTEYVTKIEEWMACYSSDLIIAVSDKDKDRFVNRYNTNKISVIPSGVDLSKYDTDRTASEAKKELNVDSEVTTVGFHGTYWYPPNKEAVNIIRKRIAPKHKEDNITFLLAGTDMPHFEEDNIKSVGFVDDLSLFLDAVDIAVIPISTGGGTNIKIFDYLGSGTPMVVSDVGSTGIDIQNYKEAIIVDNIDEYTKGVRLLMEDTELYNKLSSNSKLKARNKYDWDKICDKLFNSYTKLVSK